MKKSILTFKATCKWGFLPIAAFFCFFSGFSQTFNLRLRVTVPISHFGESIFVAGNFNEWNPGLPEYNLKREDSIFTIEIPVLKKDVYEFKFTRGNWGNVEVQVDGKGVDNHVVALSSDSLLEFRIAGWQDDFPPVPKPHTASRNVHLVDTAFYMPQLDRYRRVWVYLPPGYRKAKNKERYPVLYMHDGQNLFDEYTSAYGEWGIDECLDSMISEGRAASIVVGIDCGPKRMNEYNPYDFEKYGEGEGEKYMQFIVKTLKPYIDKHYRTQKGKESTLIAGSSMGGLISYYALLTYPNVFSKAGVFSPAFWTAPEIEQLTDSLGDNNEGRIFFYMGGLEGGSYVDDMREIADNIGKRSDAIIYSVIDPEGRHNEQSWRNWFPEFYSWIMSDGFNSPSKKKKLAAAK